MTQALKVMQRRKDTEADTELGCKASLSDAHWAKAWEAAEPRISGGSLTCTECGWWQRHPGGELRREPTHRPVGPS